MIQESAHFSWASIIAILVAVCLPVLALACRSRCKKGGSCEGLSKWIPLGALLLVGSVGLSLLVGGLLWYSTSRSSNEGWTSYPQLSRLNAPATGSSASSSLEADWQHLQRTRIVLDDEPAKETKPTETASENTTKEKTLAEKRPEWVDAPPKLIGKVYSRVVSSGPYSTIEECHRDLEPLLMDAVRQRLQKLTESEISSIQPLDISRAYVLRNICRDPIFVEELDSSVGNMKIVHVLMEFRAAQDEHLLSAWRRYQRHDSLAAVGVGASLLLAGLGLVYGLLKVDTWTRGDYTKRLLFGTAAAILALVTLASMS